MLKEIKEKKLLRANAVIGLFPANSVGDDVEVYTDDSRKTVLTTFHMLRQQYEKVDDRPYYCISDFLAPKETGIKDYIGGFAVTSGIGIDEIVKAYEDDHDDYRSILMKALADRLAEAFAERLHEIVRKEIWGYVPEENLTKDSPELDGYRHNQLVHGDYVGIRPAPGYPAQPDHTEKPILFKLLDVERNTGINLTESNAMFPAASVCGIYFAHPQSTYFAIERIARDQVEEYAKRKGMDVATVEKWLGPNLGYET